MIPRRAQRATLTAGARPVTTRGRRVATHGRKLIKMFGKSAATDGMANEEIPGQMVEQAVSKEAIRDTRDLDHGVAAMCPRTPGWFGMDGHTTRMGASRVTGMTAEANQAEDEPRRS